MDTWFSSLLSAFAKDLVCGAANQLRYACCFNGFVDDLQGVHTKLIATKKSVEDRVEHDMKQAIRNAPVIPDWLEKDANPLNDTVESLLNEARTSRSSSCCFGRFPNLVWRYFKAKKLAKTKAEAEKCIEQGSKYIKLERVATLPGTQILPGEKSLEFESRKDAYAQLKEALNDDKVAMFGLWGMGGSGKTTMAMELKRTAEAEHLFDKVLFVPVSSNVEVRRIQDKIASALQFQFPEDEESERAQRICQRLIDEKKILLILDDVWQKLDFGVIGIPFGDNCKVLITTRSLNVCNRMNCQRKINLTTLNDEEAWALFQKQANICDDDTTLKDLGRQISNECKGLPVAIAALAGTLKDKVEVHWKVALERLRTSNQVDIETDLQNPYKCLKVSYDNLDNKEAAKSLFLLCSVFPEDYEIEVETLTIYAIGLGLVGEVQSFETRRNEVGAAKDNLVSSSLLSLSVNYLGRECVKMHDLIRDVALWIAKEDKKEIKCVLEEDATTLGCCSPIRYMWCKKVPNDLDCSGLEFLRLETCFEILPVEIFKGMNRLRVLCLENGKSTKSSLSTMSLKSLKNLRCLILSRWELGDGISPLGYLTKLESLILFFCSFSELPDVMVTKLTNLKLLSLKDCDIQREIPFQVIGRHPQLEELYYDKWRYPPKYFEPSTDYGGLHAMFFKTFSVPQVLNMFRIKLAIYLSFSEEVIYNSQRSLILDIFETSNPAVVELAKRSEVLQIGNILVRGGERNLIPDIFQNESSRGAVMKDCGWVHLHLQYSKKIECLIDYTRIHSSGEVVVVFSQLRTLRISEMDDLQTLYRGVPPSGCRLFQKLEELYIDSCPVLTSLLTLAAARSLVQLQELHISNCKGLKHIILEEEDKDSEITRQDDDDKLLMFSKMKSLCIDKCSMLEHVISFTFAQGLVQLEYLRIQDCNKLEYVFQQGMCGDNSQNPLLKIDLPVLEDISLRKNHNLIDIFPQYCSAMSPSLKKFSLETCPRFDMLCFNTFKANRCNQLQDARPNEKSFHHTLEELYIDDNFKVESVFSLSGLDIRRVSLGLREVHLANLDEMKCICVGLKNSFIFQNLMSLNIYGCRKLEVIFPASVVRCLPELQYLEISECQELKQIIEDNNIVSPPQPCFPKLSQLIIQNCNNLRRLFCSSSTCNDLPSLEYFILDGAIELEELVGGNVKVELPKLKLVLLMNLSSLCQVIELFPTQTLRIVHNCPKLCFTSSVSTLEEFREKYNELNKDLQSSYLFREKIHEIFESGKGSSTSPILYERTETATEEGSDETTTEEGSETATEEGTETTTEGGEDSASPKSIPSANVEDKLKESVQEEEAYTSVAKESEMDTVSKGEECTANFPIGPEEDERSSSLSLAVMSIEGTETSTNKGEVIPSPKPIPSSKLEDQESTVKLSLLEQRQELEEIKSIGENVQQDHTSASIEGNGLGAAVMTQTEKENSQSNEMQNEIGVDVHADNSSKDLAIVAESEGYIISFQESEDDDLVNSVQAMEKDGDGKILLTPCFGATEDNLVVKVISELEESLKMPLKDIASSDASVHRILTALKFLSQLPFEDENVPEGLKAAIDSLHHEFPSILGSFKQAFATKEMKQQLLAANHKWSALCSQFELNLIAARSTSSS